MFFAFLAIDVIILVHELGPVGRCIGRYLETPRGDDQRVSPYERLAFRVGCGSIGLHDSRSATYLLRPGML